jgi:hypothetical protein
MFVLSLHVTVTLHSQESSQKYRQGNRTCITPLGYRSGGPGSIPGTTRKKKSSGSGTGSNQPREYK